MNWDLDPIYTNSDHEMNHDRRSIPAFSSAFRSFLPLAHFRIWKSDFGRACSLRGMLRCHWSIFRLISAFNYGSHVTHSAPPTTTFFLASLIYEIPFYHQYLSFQIGVINSRYPFLIPITSFSRGRIPLHRWLQYPCKLWGCLPNTCW